jgi:hypothetical protein
VSSPRSSSRLALWGTLGAPGALLAGAAWIAAAAVAYSAIASGEPPYSYLDEAAYGVALAASLAGLGGLHARQASGRGGRLGAAGLFAALVGAALLSAGSALAALAGGALDWLPGLGLLGLLLGFVLSGVATFRAGLLPRWCGLLLIVCLPLAGVLASALGEAALGVSLGLAWLALGYVLSTRRDLSAFLRSRR